MDDIAQRLQQPCHACDCLDLRHEAANRIEELEKFVVAEGECHVSYKEVERLMGELHEEKQISYGLLQDKTKLGIEVGELRGYLAQVRLADFAGPLKLYNELHSVSEAQ